jgi:predicted SprT family Zn-dependent metalloprotease
MKLIINKFDKILNIIEQQEIQDFLSGYNIPYYFEYDLECDICNAKVEFLNKHDTKESGIINICGSCKDKIFIKSLRSK